MNEIYRMIHFEPDPFTGARYPLGAVVVGPGGAVHVVKADRLPTAACLGDPKLALVVQRLHRRLDEVRSAEVLPATFGPYVTLSEAREVPDGIANALGWVQGLFTGAQRGPAAP